MHINPYLLTTTIVAPPSNASRWQMGFNSAFEGLKNLDKGRAHDLSCSGLGEVAVLRTGNNTSVFIKFRNFFD